MEERREGADLVLAPGEALQQGREDDLVGQTEKRRHGSAALLPRKWQGQKASEGVEGVEGVEG